jgi:polyhydroxyalkanoate synthesis regulator phasin
VALQLLPFRVMAQDFEQFVKDVFGNITQFSSDQMSRLNAKINEIAREALKEELAKLYAEVADLRARVATLEAERVAASAEQA